jgi:hypothetical protein
VKKETRINGTGKNSKKYRRTKKVIRKDWEKIIVCIKPILDERYADGKRAIM